MKIIQNVYYALILSVTIGIFPEEVDSSVDLVPLSLQKDINIYEPLISFLVSTGLPEQDVKLFFQDIRTEYYKNLLVDKLPSTKHSSSHSFVKRNEIKRLSTDQFLKEYNEYLENAEKIYNVDKETIAAVLYVETKFGKFIGRYSIFNTLTSLAIANEEHSLDTLYNRIDQKYSKYSDKRRSNLKKYYKKYAARKSLLAKMELANLIKIQLNNETDIHEISGSYAGAFGYPQFMPSSFLKYGVDGDNDGIVDLFNFPDAIYSIANYLSEKGWDTDHRAKRLALLRYNYSKKYVNDVFACASNFRNSF